MFTIKLLIRQRLMNGAYALGISRLLFSAMLVPPTLRRSPR